MKRLAFSFAALGAFALLGSCSSGFPTRHESQHLVVIRKDGNFGTPDVRLPINFSPSNVVKVRVEARRTDGSLDTDANNFVRISVKPGTVYSAGNGSTGRNVQLKAGVADDIDISVIASFGDTRIWAEDVGYVPVTDLTRKPPPACSDGVDNDGDGVVDFPADPGCFAPNDDTEETGTLATGVSDTIYYALPRIADVRGATTTGGTATPFPKEQLKIDTGYVEGKNGTPSSFLFDTVVTRIASDGFYVTDVQDQTTRGYASVFMFTFSAPQKLGVCDRLRSLQGTASDFFGFTEMGFPTWSVETWDPKVRPCLVPEPRVFTLAEVKDTTVLFRYESALVRLLSNAPVAVHIGAHIGPGKPDAPAYASTDTASNCDLNGSGKVDFSLPDEAACSNACTADPECSEFQSFLGQGNFALVLTDGVTTSKAQGNGGAAPDFDPVTLRGKPVKAFTGTMRYFSGGNQFTIEARCVDDIVLDMNATPLASDKACVIANDRDPNLP